MDTSIDTNSTHITQSKILSKIAWFNFRESIWNSPSRNQKEGNDFRCFPLRWLKEEYEQQSCSQEFRFERE